MAIRIFVWNVYAMVFDAGIIYNATGWLYRWLSSDFIVPTQSLLQLIQAGDPRTIKSEDSQRRNQPVVLPLQTCIEAHGGHFEQKFW